MRDHPSVKIPYLHVNESLTKDRSLSQRLLWIDASPYFLLGAQDQRLGAEQDQLPCGSTETSSGNCQETKTCMVQACFSLSKTTLQGTLEGGRCCGRQRKCWMDNVKEWTFLPMPELLSRAACRKDWTRISAESSLMFLLTNQSVKGLN